MRAVPTSQAVKNLVGTLTGSIGSSTSLIKSITETSGAITTGTTIDITTTVSNDDNKIPTAGAVYKMNQTSIYSALGALNLNTVGSDGNYIKTIEQTDGQVNASMQEFDKYTPATGNTSGSWNSGAPSNNNVPTSQAVVNYVSVNKQILDNKIDGLNFPSTSGPYGASGYFLRTIEQRAGEITATQKAFETAHTKIASGTTNSYSASGASGVTYSSDDDTAPTVKATAEEIKRLDQRLDATYNQVANLNTSATVSDGMYISGITQTTGKIANVAMSSLATTAASGNHLAITSEAVRNAINNLTASSV